jgi:predicted DNA-binding transcriptional regulator AlpA
MAPTALAPTKFRREAERRLIDTWELMLMCGLRSRQGVYERVTAGKLPQPVYTKTRSIALWDLDEVKKYLDTDGKEG